MQLFHSGNDSRFYRPVRPGDVLDRMQVVAEVEDKQSEFAGRSVIVTNKLTWANQDDVVVTDQRKWFVHAERRSVKDRDPSAPRPPKDEPAHYTDEQLSEIEAAYDNEFLRGIDTLWYEDVAVGEKLPTMVKGPLTVTDLINMHMGGGWFGYGNPALRLGFENRKKMRGFYTKNDFGAWDVVRARALGTRAGSQGRCAGCVRYWSYAMGLVAALLHQLERRRRMALPGAGRIPKVQLHG